ncbi:PucR family transcriptional regulator [Nocardia sp. NPDC059246]|uniref:PucR family transcriptional regulator n=1 Tax=unclassified Nocardia TaxID=2637762 RepID=UPI00368B3015
MTKSQRPTTAKRRLLARAEREAAQLTDRIVARARTEMPGYGALSATAIGRDTRGLVDRLFAALREERPLTDDDVRALREYGETRARQGVSLVDVQNGCRIAVREVLDVLAAAAGSGRLADRNLLAVTRDLLDIADQATMAFSGGHREVELELARQDQQERVEFVRGLLLGLLGPADIRVDAQRFGLELDADYRAVRVGAGDSVATAELRRVLGGVPARGLTAVVDGNIAGFVTASAVFDAGIDGVIGIGSAVRLDHLPRSFRLAGRMLSTAVVYGVRGIADLDRLGLLPMVTVDPDFGSELARRFLDPLADGDMARSLVDTVECYLESGMRIDATAARLVVHPNTVRYRISRFEQQTGADLRAAHVSAQVWWAIQHRRADGSG